MKLRLNRISQSEHGTFGVLSCDELPLCVTLERPWADNKPKISRILPGTYHCIPHTGSHFKDVWELQGVPNRSAILIHGGNVIADTEGCILVGQNYYMRGIFKSQVTLDYLRGKLGKYFDLEVKDSF